MPPTSSQVRPGTVTAINTEPTKHSVSLVIPSEAVSILCGMSEMKAVAS